MKPVNVLLFSRYDRLGASSRLRFFQYIPELEKSKIFVTVKPLFTDEYLKSLYSKKAISKKYIIRCYFKRFLQLFTVSKYDFIWIEKELFPYLPAWFEKLLNLFGVRYIVDYDDAIFHNYDLSDNKWVIRCLKNKIDSVMKNAWVVSAGNSYLANRAILAKANRVVIIPTVVDHHRYCETLLANKQLVIGWVGSPSTQKYIINLSSVLQTVCLKFNAKLVLVGAQADIVCNFPQINVDVIPWTEESESNIIKQFDLGIMPLPDGPWEKGKCGYKLIQYMASGKPVVASDVGVNKEIVESANAGTVVSNNIEWESALGELLSNNELRCLLGKNAREAVVHKYSVASQLSILSNLFKKDL